MLRYAIVSLGLLSALSGCKDTPSYALRWELASRQDPSDGIALTSAYQCSELGITAVEVLAIDDRGVVDVSLFPCFPESFEDADGKVEGPELPSGSYALQVRGVQRDRKPWIDEELLAEQKEQNIDPDTLARCMPDVEPFGCRPVDIACACDAFDVVTDETYDGFDDFVLTPPPPECEDAVDNDVDGFVDAQDPGCTPRDGGGPPIEGSDVTLVQFRMLVTILDVNPVATCGDPITKFRIAAVGQSGDPIALAVTECRLNGPLFFASEIAGDDGPFTIEVTGLGIGDEPLTKAVVGATMVDASTEALIDVRVDFGEDDFDPPLVASSKVFLVFESEIGDGYRGCAPESGEGRLTLAETRLALVDLEGEPVAALPPFDGVPAPCSSAKLPTQGLEWGGYRLVAEARADDGTVCYATPPEGLPLAPGDITVNLPRVLVDGVPPASCRDCGLTDLACETNECVDGVCR